MSGQADTLYAPSTERVVTTNAWAFLHWLRTTRGTDLAGWDALQRFSVGHQAAFWSAIADFARLPAAPLRLARHGGPQDALVLRRADGARVVFGRQELLAPHPSPPGREPRGRPLPQAGEGDTVAALLARAWPPALLVRPLAELLLHADIRPDDCLLVAGSASWPWLAALLEGTKLVLAAATPQSLLATAADEGASILVAPAQWLAEAAFQRARQRPNLARLRTIIATGGPLSPEGRARVYTWIKSDVLLLARTGDTLWGNPLEPVYARPAATPRFFTPPPSDPAPP